MVEIYIVNNKKTLDLLDDASITYVKQVSDIGDFSVVNNSFSWTFKIPRTKNNENILNNLGLVGSVSEIPYQEIEIYLFDNGIPIVKKGKLIIDESLENEYKAHIKDGAISFYDDIGSDTFEDLNLSKFSHKKTFENITATWSENFKDYKYLISWLGVPLLLEENNSTNLPLENLTPFILIENIFKTIENKYGWTFSNIPEEILNKYISGYTDYGEDGLSYKTGDFSLDGIFNNIPQPNSWTKVKVNINQEDNDFISLVNSEIVITDPGVYVFEVLGLLKYINNNFPEVEYGLAPRLNINDNDFYPINSHSIEEIELSLVSGDIVKLEILSPVLPPNGIYPDFTFFSDGGYIKVFKKDTDIMDFSVLFKKLKVKDFIKEILIRTAATPFFDVEKKTITLKTVKERIESDYVDLSKYYVRRVSERYIYQNFAQENILKHKYNNEGQNYDDGIFFIENKNIEAEKTLYNSFTYAREENLISYNDNGNSYPVYYLKSFEIENSDDPEKIEYKDLNERYFIVDFYDRENTDINIESEFINSNIPIANPIPTRLKTAVLNWRAADNILQKSKIIKVEMRIDKFNFSQIDLSKVVYFEQELAYFIINKLTLKKDKSVEAELIKINNYG